MKPYIVKQGTVYLEITSKCNLHCQYCYNDSRMIGSELPFEKIVGLMEYLASVGIHNITISGGEPFLHSRFFDILDYANKIKMHIYIVTNASKLSNAVFERIKPYMELLSFQFTFDGFREETHAKSRGKHNYSNVKKCVAHMVSCGYADRIYLRYNITSYNFMEIYDFIKYWASEKCKSISLSYILNQGRANAEILVSDNQEKITQRLIDQAKLDFPEMNIKFTAAPVVTCPYAVVQENQELIFLPRIDSDGNVYPCQVEVDPRFIIGNIFEEDLSDIIESAKMNSYIKYITEKESRNPKCKSCIMSKLCGGGCVAMETSCKHIQTGILRELLYKTLY